MPPPAIEEDPRHAQFLDLCLLYGDFNRPVFLEAILRFFVEAAGAKELAALRRAVRDRAKTIRSGGRNRRPRGEESRAWLRATLRLVWLREVEHWTWPKIAAAAGMKPTKPNIRTLQRRCDHFAVLVWRATHGRGDHPKALRKMLEAKPVQRWYRSQLGLPFDSHPEECKRLVRILVSRGLHLAARRP
ncbi:MAG TPA: hypothetical protein VJW51_14930 [Candidatus Acidoferrales bacterium]|nr:hypothetical protein [Candidatus Acidoferrales bacterium]